MDRLQFRQFRQSEMRGILMEKDATSTYKIIIKVDV